MPDAREERFRALAGMLAASERAGGDRAESLTTADTGGVPESTDAILVRIEANLAPLAPVADTAGGGSDGGDGEDPLSSLNCAQDRARALDRLLEFGGAALAKVRNRDFGLSPDEGCAMEAIIIVDGSRPSFVLRKNAVDLADPFIRDWRGPLAAARDPMEQVAAAVGRIQPAGGNASTYIGTGTLVDRDKGLVLTNFHVVDDAEHVHSIAMHREGDRVVVDGHLEIDFLGESGSFDSRRFRIREFRLPLGHGRVFAGVDAAVCRIDPQPLDDGVALPAVVKPLSSDPDYANGALTSLAVIGFPGPPAMDKGDEVDWDFVMRKLFGNRFGIKRLAPGRFHGGLGSHPADATARRAIGHDATTFGGASGALVTAWLDSGAPAFALHFAGETIASNYALSFAKARGVLEPLGVPFA